MHNLFRNALENSISKGLITKDTDLQQEAEYLVGIAQSVSVYCKIKSKEEIINYINFSLDKIS